MKVLRRCLALAALLAAVSPAQAQYYTESPLFNREKDQIFAIDETILVAAVESEAGKISPLTSGGFRVEFPGGLVAQADLSDCIGDKMCSELMFQATFSRRSHMTPAQLEALAGRLNRELKREKVFVLPDGRLMVQQYVYAKEISPQHLQSRIKYYGWTLQTVRNLLDRK